MVKTVGPNILHIMDTQNTMELHIPDWFGRSDIRKTLMQTFCAEPAGSGKWTYLVDRTPTTQVYLIRPTALNKGMDFEIRTEGLKFTNRNKIGKWRTSTRPSHDTILQDLAQKKFESPSKYKKLFKLITAIYHCQPIPENAVRKLQFKIGYPVDAVLKVLRWMFIEQDVTYWNWSGRQMLYEKLLRIDDLDASKNFIEQFT